MIVNVFWGGLKHKHVQLFNRSKVLLLNDFTCFFFPFLRTYTLARVHVRGKKKGVKSFTKGYLTGVEALNVFFQKRREKSFIHDFTCFFQLFLKNMRLSKNV